MTPFHVGMKVVCVDDDFTDAGRHPKIVFGEVYTVSNIEPGRFTPRSKYPNTSVGLFLAGVDPFLSKGLWIGRIGLAEQRFRPAHENRMDELRQLLVPTPSNAKTHEKAAS